MSDIPVIGFTAFRHGGAARQDVEETHVSPIMKTPCASSWA